MNQYPIMQQKSELGITQALEKCYFCRQCPQIGRQYGIKYKAAIALQSKSNVKQIAALLFIP